jgi:hypothetical protein
MKSFLATLWGRAWGGIVGRRPVLISVSKKGGDKRMGKKDLAQAISGAQSAESQLAARNSEQADMQAAYDLALSNKTSADNAQVAAVEQFNAALDDLIEAATAAKIGAAVAIAA